MGQTMKPATRISLSQAGKHTSGSGGPYGFMGSPRRMAGERRVFLTTRTPRLTKSKSKFHLLIARFLYSCGMRFCIVTKSKSATRVFKFHY